MKLSRDELKGLMKNKLMKAGLSAEHADMTLHGQMKEVTTPMGQCAWNITAKELPRAESR